MPAVITQGYLSTYCWVHEFNMDARVRTVHVIMSSFIYNKDTVDEVKSMHAYTILI